MSAAVSSPGSSHSRSTLSIQTTSSTPAKTSRPGSSPVEADAHLVPSAAATVAVSSSTLHPSTAPARDSSSPSTSSLLTAPSPAPAHLPSSPSALLDPRRRTTRSLSPSSSSPSSLSSLSSRWSLLPLRTFQRAHLLVFALSFLLLFVLPVGLLVGYRRQVLWAEFGLGVGSWLAGETLRDVIFELLTPSATRGIALPPDTDDYDNQDEVTQGEPASRGRRRVGALALALPTVVHSLAQELLRLGAVALTVALLPSVDSSHTSHPPRPNTPAQPHLTLQQPSSPRPRPPLPPLDPLFFSALWLALGWAAIEILWGSRRLWKQLELYHDVLPGSGYGTAGALAFGEGDVDEEGVLMGLPRSPAALGHGTEVEEGGEEGGSDMSHHGPYYTLDDDPRRSHQPGDEEEEAEEREEEESELDEEEFQARWREVQREELEGQLGVPLYEIPVGVVFVWRLDSILLSLVFTLLLSLPFRLTPPSLFAFPLPLTFLSVSLLHAFLSWIWVARVREWGVPAISFASLVLLVLMCFAVGGAWGVLE
ncbi:hypothetical protein JCM11641_006754 [Rhodosporidiobolus odoratus]